MDIKFKIKKVNFLILNVLRSVFSDLISVFSLIEISHRIFITRFNIFIMEPILNLSTVLHLGVVDVGAQHGQRVVDDRWQLV